MQSLRARARSAYAPDRRTGPSTWPAWLLSLVLATVSSTDRAGGTRHPVAGLRMRYPAPGTGSLAGSGGAHQLSGASARGPEAAVGRASVYLLALDESGTHGTAPALIIAGLAVHEHDIRPLNVSLDAVLDRHLKPLGLDPHQFELHAAEIKSPPGGRAASTTRAARSGSPWRPVPTSSRLAVIADAYKTLTTFSPRDPALPPRVFGAIVDRRHRTFAQADRRAYDHVLHRFDEMLQRLAAANGVPQVGMVVHDRNRQKERAIQDLAARWQRTGARLDTLAHVPLFTDSRSSRLVQAADFIASALWRYYGLTSPGSTEAEPLWPLVDTDRGMLSGVIHLTPDYRSGVCTCPPCASRRH